MQNLSKTENIILRIEKIVNGGYGLAFQDKEAYFVPYVHPGEAVLTVEVERKKGVYFVKDFEIVEPSTKRIKPKCMYFGNCGGCDFQMADYRTQLDWKRSILEDTSQRLLKVNIFEEGLEFSYLKSPEWNYRFRARFQAGSRNAGFFRKDTNEIVEISRCLIVKEKINTAFKVITEKLKSQKDSDFISGLKAFELRTNPAEDAVSVLFISSSGNGIKEFTGQIVSALEEFFETVSIAVSLSKSRLPAKGYRTVYGPEKIYSVFGRYSFGFSPLTFFQPNLETAFKVYETIKELLKKEGAKRVLDVYCGAGILDILLSDEFEVLGIEANPFGYRDAVENAFINESSAEFINLEAEALSELKEADAVIANPPRSGLSRNLLQLLVQAGDVRNFIYVSCNPATFFRDAGYLLKGGYSLNSLHMVDFYPQTAHIEVLAVFRKI